MMIPRQVPVMEVGRSGKHRTLSKEGGATINILGGNIHYVSQVAASLSSSSSTTNIITTSITITMIIINIFGGNIHYVSQHHLDYLEGVWVDGGEICGEVTGYLCQSWVTRLSAQRALKKKSDWMHGRPLDFKLYIQRSFVMSTLITLIIWL